MVHVVTIGIIVCGFLTFGVVGQNMLGAGKWSVLYAQPCAEDAEMPWRVRLRKHRVNRTHDAFDAELALGAPLDDSYGVRVVICKKADGGCKHFLSNGDDCLPCVARQYAAENLAKALQFVGVDPPDFPIPEGQYSAVNYLLDTNDLSKTGVYGEYVAQCYIVKDGRDMACLEGSVRYDPIDGYSPMSPFG